MSIRQSIVLLLLAGAVSAQSARLDTAKHVDYAYRYRLLGVYDEKTGEPVEGVEVSNVLSGVKAMTTRTGTVSLLFLPEGTNLVRLRKVGYELKTLTVDIAPSETNPVTAVLSRTIELPAVVVKDSAPRYISPGLRGFEERREAGIGHFIPEEIMRKGETHTLGDVITGHIPGVMTIFGIKQSRPTSKFIVSTRKLCAGETFRCGMPDCFVTVYENGVRTYDANTSDVTMIPDFERMNARDYTAVEFYNVGEAPPEYMTTGSGCGVLVLWTREK